MTWNVDCRADEQLWMTVANQIQVSSTQMTSRPAYTINDEQTVTYTMNSDVYKVKYAGAAVSVDVTDSSSRSGGYVQVDLMTVRYVGGVLTQGGYYQQLTPVTQPLIYSWMTQFTVALSNDSVTFLPIVNSTGVQQVDIYIRLQLISQQCFV